MNESLKQKLFRPSIWLRLVSMIVLAIAFNIVEIVIFAVVVFQFLAALFTRKPNSHFTRFGQNLASYLQQITAYLTFASEDKPFPFSPWPDKPQDEPLVAQNEEQMNSKPEQTETVAENSEAAKPQTAPRKSASTRKPRTPKRKDS